MEQGKPLTTVTENNLEQVFSESNVSRRRFLQGVGYSSLALAGAGMLDLWAASDVHASSLTTTPWTDVPILLRVTDAVKPGELLTIYGEGLHSSAGNLQIAVSPAPGPVSLPQPPVDAYMLTPIFSDPDGHFTTAVLPGDAAPGVYAVWVQNDYGWSQPILLNAARPQWISESAAFAGLQLKVVGRNLDSREFGGLAQTLVRLVSGRTHYEMKIEDINPFAVTFTIPHHVPNGTYDVYVSNGGDRWEKISYAEEYNQHLTIVDAAPDPLGLGVWWVNQFNWGQQVSVQDYGADPNGSADSTGAFQSAINDIASRGGGIISIPDGNYRITTLTLPPGTILRGQSQAGTTLIYANTAANASKVSMISAQTDATGASAGTVGLARLTVTVDPTNPNQVYPDQFFLLGDAWGARVQDELQRTAQYMFLKEVSLTYPLTARTGRAIGCVTIGKGHFVLQDSHLYGYWGVLTSTYISQYSQVSNTTMEASTGEPGVGGIYIVLEGNTLTFHPELQLGDTHGFFTRGPSYVANNLVNNVGTAPSYNDGEAYGVEGYRGQTKMIGTVTAASSTTVSVNPRWVHLNYWEDPKWNPWDITHHSWAGWHIVITDGRGLGQDRLLTSWDGASTYTLSKPWDVLPDTSSKFAVLVAVKAATFYHNDAKNAAKGYWFYNDVIDGVMSSNTGENIEGFYVSTYYIETANKDYRFTVGYFNRIANNTMTGVSTRDKVGGIGTRVELGATDAYAYNIYGFSIKNNSVTSVLPAPTISGYTEAPTVNGLYVVNMNDVQKATRNAILGAFIEHNTVTDSNRGISLGGTGYPLYSPAKQALWNPTSNGILITANTFNNVTTQVTDNGTTGTVYYP
jgi:Endopolygalacturonase